MDVTLVNYLNVAGVLGILLYWEVRELTTTAANKQEGGHSRLLRIGIRLLMPIVGLLLIGQLLGFVDLSSNLSSPATIVFTVIGQVIFWLGVIIGVWARETIDKHWAHAAEYQVMPGHELVTRGPYTYVRHPIYTALLAIFLSIQLSLTSWLIVLTVPLYGFIQWQAQHEEKLLIATFGDRYQRYQSSTGAIVPLPKL